MSQVRDRFKSFYRMTQESFILLIDLVGDEITQTFLFMFEVLASTDELFATIDVGGVACSEIQSLVCCFYAISSEIQSCVRLLLLHILH